MCQSSTNILDIPGEVIEDNICPYLGHNDVLRLRGVSQLFKHYSDNHIRSRSPNLTNEFRIDEHTIKAFVCLGIRATRFALNVPNSHFFVDFEEEIDEFLTINGHNITHIRVEHFYAFTVDYEWEFYERLNNLKYLKIHKLDGTRLTATEAKDGLFKRYPFPTSFENLESIEILRVINLDYFYWEPGPSPEVMSEVSLWQCDLLDFCENLVHFLPPLASDFQQKGVLWQVLQKISRRNAIDPNGPTFTLDVTSLGDLGIDVMCHLLDISIHGNMQLLNVHAQSIEKIVMEFDTDYFDAVGQQILSIREMCSNFFYMEMPNLTKVEFKHPSNYIMPDDFQGSDLEWPKLETLNIQLSNNVESIVLESLLFYRDEPRENLTDLTLGLTNFFDIGPVKLAYPTPLSVTTTCPNLTKLSLRNYPAPDMDFSELWEGLPLLQELSLAACYGLGDDAFLGKDVDTPSFLRLTRLKKFTLCDLDRMPKLTNIFFVLVLRHMKLTHLTLHSVRPINSVNIEGLEALLTGNFAKTIEKFPFHGWSLARLSYYDFCSLAYKFRSTSELVNGICSAMVMAIIKNLN